MIVDRQIAWTRDKFLIPTSQWLNGSIAAKNIISEVNINTTGAMSFQGTVWDQVTTGGTGHTASGIVQGKLLLPIKVNPEFPLGFRVHFITEVNTSNTHVLLPTILCNINPVGSAMKTAATGALDTPIVATSGSSALTKGILRKSNRGIRNGNWATRSQIFDGLWLEWSLMWKTLTGYALTTSARLWVTHLEIDYVPMRTKFPHNEIDSPLDDLLTS